MKTKEELKEEDLDQVVGGQGSLNKPLTKLSSGMKISSSSDDSDGYQICERTRD